MVSELSGLLVGAIALGVVHGIEPGHGWPVAASYALDRSNKWLYGAAASLILGIGHLISSIAMVAVFFYAKGYFQLTQIDEPITVGVIELGGPVSLVAGILLVVLGIREYRHGHTHSIRDQREAGASEHETDHSDHGHGIHDHDHTHDHSHGSGTTDEGHRQHDTEVNPVGAETDRGLLGIAWFAFVLGFAHEEEFEIIAMCAGSEYCLELMLAYAVTVIGGIVALTLALIAGYQEFEDELERYTPYLPVVSAVVLVGMGLGFVTGLF